VAKLQECVQFNVGTAAVALECFNELFNLVCSHHKDKLQQFLGEVGMSVQYEKLNLLLSYLHRTLQLSGLLYMWEVWGSKFWHAVQLF
jgi:hypothetical protein